MKHIMNWMLAAILICGTTVFTSCNDNTDNPVPAKKKYRLVQRKDVYDTSDAYYITDYTYDDQGRLASYVRVGYNTQYSDGAFVDARYTYTYEDHSIIERHLNSNTIYYYTLNDDGLVVKVQPVAIEDGVETLWCPDYLQYKDGRILSIQDTDANHLTVFHYEGDDLMYFQREDVEVSPVMNTFTRSGLSVDHGYLNTPHTTMTEPLYMMGYFGKPSKHLESHEKSESKTGSLYASFDYDYTYTIADGHIVEMMEVTHAIIDYGFYKNESSKTTTSTFTYEEVK
jgi:hypothetical protein